MLKVLHVVDSLEVGGLERVVCDLAKAQHAQGHDVSVFSINKTAGLLQELTSANVQVVVGNKSRGWDLGVLGKLRHAARNADVVHAHNFVPNYYSAAALLAVQHRPVQVCTCHDMGMRLSNRKLRWMFRWSLTRTARVAMVGRQVHERYVTSGMVPALRASTVLNGVPVEQFTPSEARRSAARVALGLTKSAVVIGCVGRLVPLKNHRLIIEVWPGVLRRHPEARLVIVGGGILAETLRGQVTQLGLADQVVFMGERSDVADLLPAFDVFALPSLTEGLSVSLLEACATGLAVVTTAVGGNPEVVQPGRTGLLVPADDGPALSDALILLLDRPDERQRLGRAALDWVIDNASIEALSRSYDTLYRLAMTSSPN